jgi:hypothetical protein
MRAVELRELNRTLLARQLLLERRRMPVTRAVSRLVALQAQYAPSPYVALWSRLDGFRKEQLTRALVTGTIVKTGSLRTTLHVMARSDFPWIFAAHAESQRGRINAGRTIPTVRTAPIGPWPHTKPPPSVPWTEDLPNATVAARRVVRAYLAAYGPATRQDIAKFTGFRMPQIDPALEGLRERDGYWDVPRTPRLQGDEPAPVRFLPAFDSIILAHQDRTRIVPSEYEEIVFNKKNATVKNTFTVDGFVAGAWRVEGGELRVEPFAPLPVRWRRDVDAEGARLLAWYLA